MIGEIEAFDSVEMEMNNEPRNINAPYGHEFLMFSASRF